MALTVAVVGGSGFLGRQVVSRLEKWATEESNGGKIKEIRVLDIRPFTPFGDAKGTSVYQECDVRNSNQLTRSLQGVNVVVNCSAVKPDLSQDDLTCGPEMEKVNVDGVKNLVQACQEVGAQVLVHTSTLAVKVGGVKLIEHTETLTPPVPPEDLFLGDYARGRLKAEQVVLKAHNSATKTGSTLSTVVLRPPVFMYGEGDKAFVPHIHRLAEAGGNQIPAIGNRDAFLQAAYVGNVAAAHVEAVKKLMEEKEEVTLQSIGGMEVYLTDDTPPHNLPGLALPFLEQFGVQPARDLSYWTVTILMLLSRLWGALWSLLGAGPASPVPSRTLHRFTSIITVVSRLRAELSMGFEPPFSWQEALDRSKAYYASVLSPGKT